MEPEREKKRKRHSVTSMGEQVFQRPIHGHNVLAGINVSGNGTLHFNDHTNQPKPDQRDSDLQLTGSHSSGTRNFIQDVYMHDQSQVYIGNNTINNEGHPEMDNQCMKALFVADSEVDKAHIQKAKGGLLENSYRWILNHNDFKQFRNNPESRLLWIKGSLGKGKTMLLCGILEELEKEQNLLTSYFFCQATQQHRNDTTSVLRGLIWLLCKRHPRMLPYIQDEYKIKGDKLFEGPHPWVALGAILAKMLNAEHLGNAIFAIDALDECRDEYRDNLIELIVNLSRHSSSKWIVCSRNDVGPKLDPADFEAAQQIIVQLELNQDSISDAVNRFIHFKAARLARIRKYKEEHKQKVIDALINKADNTFLWVALVCEELEKVKTPHIDKTLVSIPSGLDKLYQRMLDQISTGGDVDVCREILATICISYRPLRVDELSLLVKDLASYGNDELLDLVQECGSFLTFQDNIIYLVHQSAQDFLMKDTIHQQVFSLGIPNQHLMIFQHSLDGLMTLKRNIYDLDCLEVLIKEVSSPDPSPLSHLGYSCVHWVDHFTEAGGRRVSDDEAVGKFIREKFLYWLEALSLLGKVPDGSAAMQKLGEAMVSDINGLTDSINDARRLIMLHRHTIKVAPLQVYASVLLFTPENSLTRNLFKKEEPGWILSKPNIEPDWDACVQTIKTGAPIQSIAFSPDSSQVASGGEKGVKLWNVASGQCLRSLNTSHCVEVIAISPKGQLAAGLGNGVIELWDFNSGLHQRRLRIAGYNDNQFFMSYRKGVSAINFSPDGGMLASASNEGVHTWDPITGKCLQKMDGPQDAHAVAFSADGQQLASTGRGYKTTVKIWDANTGACLWTLDGHTKWATDVFFLSTESLASYSFWVKEFKIWDLTTGNCVKTLQTKGFYRIILADDCQKFASAFDHRDQSAVRLWSFSDPTVQILTGHTKTIRSLVFSSDGRSLASAGDDGKIKIWDPRLNPVVMDIEYHQSGVQEVIFSPNGRWLASRCHFQLKVWDAFNGSCVHNLTADPVQRIMFSSDSQYLLSDGFANNTTHVKIWDVITGNCILTCNNIRTHRSIFSPSSHLLAVPFWDKTVQIWHLETQKILCNIPNNPGVMTFSPDSHKFVITSDKDIEIWDISMCRCIQTIHGEILDTKIHENTDINEDTNINEDTDIDDDELNHHKSLRFITISANYQWLAASTDRYIFIVDLKTWSLDQFFEVPPKSYIHSLSLSSNGRRLVSSSSFKGNFSIWDLRMRMNNKVIHSQIKGYIEPRFDLAFDSRLSTSFGVVDFSQGFTIQTFDGYHAEGDKVYGYTLSADGRWIINGHRRVLFMPTEYRSHQVATNGSSIAIGFGTGRVLMMRFS